MIGILDGMDVVVCRERRLAGAQSPTFSMSKWTLTALEGLAYFHLGQYRTSRTISPHLHLNPGSEMARPSPRQWTHVKEWIDSSGIPEGPWNAHGYIIANLMGFLPEPVMLSSESL
jgi:hypothetical protein